MANIMYGQASQTPHVRKTCGKLSKLKPKAERPRCPVDCLEEERKERYENLKACTPRGFHVVLEKIIRSVALARPIHVCLFIADLLDAELSKRTFDDLMYGCQLKKSLRRQPCMTDSCLIINNFLMSQHKKGVDDAQFRSGLIPQYELTEPALDRYRDHAGIGEFVMPPIEEPEPEETAVADEEGEGDVISVPRCPSLKEKESKAKSVEDTAVKDEDEKPAEVEDVDDDAYVFPKSPCLPQHDFTSPPALDRYREFAGIGPFELDDVIYDETCYDHKKLGVAMPNCKCMFCTLKAEKSRPPTRLEEKTACTQKQPDLQTLYIEQPVYREPEYDKERLFKEKNIKGYEPFGAFKTDEQYMDHGLQPPDPFKEHPIDRDILSESPQESSPDDPKEEPIGPEPCEETTSEVECEEATPCTATVEESTPAHDLFHETPLSAKESEGQKCVPVSGKSSEAKDFEGPQSLQASQKASEVSAKEAGTAEHETDETQAVEAAPAEEQTHEAVEQENVEAVAEEEPTGAEQEAAEATKEEEHPGEALAECEGAGTAEGEEEQSPAGDTEAAET